VKREGRIKNLRTAFHYLGIVLILFAFLQALPLIISAICLETVQFPFRIYVIPAAVSAALGVGLVTLFRARPPPADRSAMATAALGWFTLSLIGVVSGPGGLHDHIRSSLFHVVSIATSTGFTTQDVTGATFSPVAKQVFLLLMVIGGCVGSTSGGVKVLRVGVMGKLLWQQPRFISCSSRQVNPLLVDGEIIRTEEVQRTAAIVFAWVALPVLGGLITGLLTAFAPLESVSGMFSALGSMGLSYISQESLVSVGTGVKVWYILAMVAGRLEILPLLLIFSRKVWT